MFSRQLTFDIGKVFIAHRAQLGGVALKILGDRQRAEDVVQDAYLKALELVNDYDVKQPRAYLFQLVRNLAIDHHRRAVLERNVFRSDEDVVSVPASTGTPETIAISHQRLTLITQTLAKLPEQTRKIFELSRLSGYTQREIAERLGVSATFVNIMLHDAVDQCRWAVRFA